MLEQVKLLKEIKLLEEIKLLKQIMLLEEIMLLIKSKFNKQNRLFNCLEVRAILTSKK